MVRELDHSVCKRLNARFCLWGSVPLDNSAHVSPRLTFIVKKYRVQRLLQMKRRVLLIQVSLFCALVNLHLNHTSPCTHMGTPG